MKQVNTQATPAIGDNSTHDAAECTRAGGFELHYHGKNWSDRFVCPICGNSRRYNLNYLGRRKVYCDGRTIVAKTRDA